MELNALNISKRFMRQTGSQNYFEAVRPTDFKLPAGQLTVLMGRSGSGKTPLLNLLSGLLKPTEGNVLLGDTDLYAMDDRALSRFRNAHFGVIPQGHAALYSLTVLENIAFPAALYGPSPNAARDAETLLERFGIAALRDASPSELSGGELRRVSIARALINRPDVVFADEPTADLDDENTLLILKTLREIADDGAAVLLVTHEAEAARFAHRAFRMDAGVLAPADART